MAFEPFTSYSYCNTALPTLYTDGTQAPHRLNRYGEPDVSAVQGSRLHALVDEGSYFVAKNATEGTGIAGIAAADGYDALEALLFLRNPSSTLTMYLDYIRLENITGVGTNGTNFNYVMSVDKGATRYASGGTAITPVNLNPNSSRTSSAQMYFGAVVTTAASADNRIVSGGQLRSAIKVIHDCYVFDFGGSSKAPQTTAASGTVTVMNVPVGPICIPPGCQFMLHEWAASQTVAATYQFQCGFWVR